MLRAGGVALLVAAWLAVSVRDFGSLNMVAGILVFVVLGTYGVLAAARIRSSAVNAERKLRMDLVMHNMELEGTAVRDDLTQLFNRRYFFDRLERELRTAKGFDRPLSIIVLDLDGLKAVNDAYGYRTGDRALAGFGSFLLGQTRASDVPARIGGDEFAIILPDTSESAADVMIKRLQTALENTNLTENDRLTLQLSASVGFSGYPWGGESVDAVMQQADASLEVSKRIRNQARAPLPAVEETPAVPAIFRKSAESADEELD